MGSHGKPKWYQSLFLKTWEVENDRDFSVERFRTQKAADEYTGLMNDDSLWRDEDGTSFYNGAVYSTRRRSF